MSKRIALFLDIDGVLNQYDNHERRNRYRKYINSGCLKENDSLNPYPKKVQRLARLVKKYNLDVYLFSAWTEDDLQPFLPFKLVGDTNKWVKNVHEVSKDYDASLLIDDELPAYIGKGKDKLNEDILTYQPNYNFDSLALPVAWEV